MNAGKGGEEKKIERAGDRSGKKKKRDKHEGEEQI